MRFFRWLRSFTVTELDSQDGPKHLTEPSTPTDVLNEADRCQLPKCGARAYVRAFIHAEFAIDYCSHHWNQHGTQVRDIALDVIDERFKLENEVAR